MTKLFSFALSIVVLLTLTSQSGAQTQPAAPVITQSQQIRTRLESAYQKRKRITVTFKTGTVCIYPLNTITLERDRRIGGKITWITDKEFKIEDSTLFEYDGCQTSIENVLSISSNRGIARAFKLTKEVLFCIITFGIPCEP